MDNIFLFFDEGPHKYTDTRGYEYTSVTTLIEDYYPSFDKDFWAHKKAVEQNKSEKAILAEWERISKEACERGTKTHNGLEDAIKETSKFKSAIKYLEEIGTGRVVSVADIPNMLPKPLDIDKFKTATNNKYPQIYSVFDYYVRKGYTIYSEICVFLPDILISGTIDILCYRPDNFVILDWKTNRDGLKFEAGYYKKDKHTIPNQLTNEWVRKSEFMLPPLGHLPNCNGMHYSMQLSLYAYATECILGIPCVGLGLCHIGSPWILNEYGQPLRDINGYHVDPNGEETVKWFRIQYLKQEAEALFQDRLIKLNATTNNTNNTELNLFDYDD